MCLTQSNVKMVHPNTNIKTVEVSIFSLSCYEGKETTTKYQKTWGKEERAWVNTIEKMGRGSIYNIEI